MSGKLGKFQTIGFTAWKGLTKDNHIGNMFQSAPQKASNFMIQLLAYKFGRTTETLLNKLPIKEFDTDDEYTWEIIGSSRRNIPLIEARDIDGTVITEGMVGAGMTPFYLVFPEDWSKVGRVI